MESDEEKKLNYFLEKWKKIFCLSDWDIKIEFRNVASMNDSQGTVTYWKRNLKAMIGILRKEDRQISNPNGDDIEHDIVHELLHIRLWAYDCNSNDGELGKIIEEQTLEYLTRAFLKLDRRNVENFQKELSEAKKNIGDKCQKQ